MSTEKMMITGYWYRDNCAYGGVFKFPNNEDKLEIHMPPKVTLIKPPVVSEIGKEAAFDIVANKWIIRDEDLSWMNPASLAAMNASKLAAALDPNVITDVVVK